MEERTIICPICGVVIEHTCVLSPDVIAKFYKWTGTINDINGVPHQSWYCPKHSKEEITIFEDKYGVK